MTNLPLVDALVPGLIVSWSLVHGPGQALPAASGHFRRHCIPVGTAAGLHARNASMLKTESYGGHPIKAYVYRQQPADMTAALRDAGLTVEAHTLLNADGGHARAILSRVRHSRGITSSKLAHPLDD